MLHNTAPYCCTDFCINAAGPSSSAAAVADGEASVICDGASEPETQKRRGRGRGHKQVAARAAAMKSGEVEDDTCVDE